MANVITYDNSNFIEAELDRADFISNRMTAGDIALFILEQELYYAQNIVGYGNIVNPPAILGIIPFSGNRIYTTLDQQFKMISSGVKKILGNLGLNDESLREFTDVKVNSGELRKLRSRRRNVSLSELGKETAVKFINKILIEDILDIVKKKSSEYTEGIPQSQNQFEFDKHFQTASDRVEDTILSDENNISNNTQLFPFYFKSLNYDNSSIRKYIFFQSTLDSLSENFSPVWNSNEIFGRPHPLWIYSSVTRSINMSFLIYANSEDDLPKVRERAEWLSKHTYPAYSGQDNLFQFKSGPFISITIGDLFKNLSGFISNLEFDWNILKRWELKNNKVFPHGFRIGMRFNVLENKLIQNTDNQEISNIYKIF